MFRRSRTSASKRLGRCPGCGEARDVDEEHTLRAAEAEWFARTFMKDRPADAPFQPIVDGMRRLAIEAHPSWFWACDTCVASGLAIPADVSKQQLGMGTPFAGYVDRAYRCEDCSAPSVFSADEQRHWFEELGFLIRVYPKQCLPCRRARRRKVGIQRELQQALAGLDTQSPEQLEAVACLYAEMDLPQKAALMNARATNIRKRRA